MWIDFIPAWLKPQQPTILPQPMYYYHYRSPADEETNKLKFKVWMKGNKECFDIISANDVFEAMQKYYSKNTGRKYSKIRCKQLDELSELKAENKRLRQILESKNIIVL